MNYTEKFHLPQWELSDRIQMDDFNQAMSSIERGLEQTALDAANGTSAAAGSASNAAAKAQAAADAAASAAADALSAANAAQATADNAFSMSYLPYKVGTYTGNGSTISVKVGFQPSFVVITAQYINSFVDAVTELTVVGPGGNLSSYVQFTSSGMNLSYSSHHPHINDNNKVYSYIAFR